MKKSETVATATPKAKTGKKQPTTVPVVPEANRPWSVNGRTGERIEIPGLPEGSKIKFQLDGKMLTGVFKYAKKSIRHPKGKLYIEREGQVYKRVEEHTEKLPVKPVVIKSGKAVAV